MARYSSGVRTGAGSTTLPIISVYATAAVSPKVREIGVFNTTTTAVALHVVLLTTAGTQGAGLVEGKHDPNSATAACTAFTTHTGAPTLGSDMGGMAGSGRCQRSQTGKIIKRGFVDNTCRTDARRLFRCQTGDALPKIYSIAFLCGQTIVFCRRRKPLLCLLYVLFYLVVKDNGR